MSNYKLKASPDRSVTVFGLQHKPTGQVLNPSLSSYLLMKYPRLATGKIVPVTASQLYLDINKYLDSWLVNAAVRYIRSESSLATHPALVVLPPSGLLVSQLLIIKQAILSISSIGVLLMHSVKPHGETCTVSADGNFRRACVKAWRWYHYKRLEPFWFYYTNKSRMTIYNISVNQLNTTTNGSN